MLTEDQAGIMLLFDEVLRKGFDADLFINGLAGHLRNLLVCKDPATIPLLEAGERLRNRYHQQSALTPTDLILTSLNLANDCDVEYKLARNKRLHVEMCLLKMASIKRAFNLADRPITNGVATEKKSPDLSVASESGSIVELKEEEKNAPQISLENVELLEEEVVATGPVNTDPILSASSLSLGRINMDSLLEDVRAEKIQPTPAADLPPLTLEQLESHWNDFRDQHAATTLSVMMKMAKPEVGEDEIIVKVGSQRTAAALRDNAGLIAYLRKQFKRPGLSMRQVMDDSLRDKAPVPKKRLTAKDKYLAMREKNPALEELRKRFDLRPEE
ncbi:MAG: hypothetical protein AAFU03_18300 [Bacteroidota bacterium]